MGKELIENSARVNAYEFIRADRRSKQDLIKNSCVIINSTIKSSMRGERSFGGALYFTTTKTNFGGLRLWFSCPNCGRRVADYYTTFYRPEYLCRHCHNLAYSSQNRHRESFWEALHKFEHKQKRIKNKLQNKWLRRPTKERFMREYFELKERCSLTIGRILVPKIERFKR